MFFPSIGLVCGGDNKRNIVENHSSFTIRIKEYSPTAFTVYRELCGIQASSILQSLQNSWVPGMKEFSNRYEIMNLNRKEKNRLLFLLRSFIAVSLNSHHYFVSTITFMTYFYFLVSVVYSESR